MRIPRFLIQKNQPFFLNFKVKDEPDEDDLPNYEYKELDNQHSQEIPQEVQNNYSETNYS